MPNTYEVQSTGVYTDSRNGIRYRAEAGKLIDETNAYYLGMPGAALPDDYWQPCNMGPGPTVASTYTVPTTAIYQDSRTGIRHQAYAGSVIAMVNAYYLGMPDTALPDDYWHPCPPDDPIAVPGLVLWFDAATLPGTDGSAVATWPDSSGNGHNATQADVAKRPVKKTAILNGLPVLRFGGGAKALEIAAVDLTATSAVSLYVVCAVPATGTIEVIFESTWDADSHTDGFLLYRDTTNGVVFSHKGNVGSSLHTSAVPVTTQAKVVACIGNKALATNETIAYVNGSASGGVTNPNANNTNAYGSQPIYIGARAGALAPMSGDIAEIRLYATAHDATARGTVEAALRAKWGV